MWLDRLSLPLWTNEEILKINKTRRVWRILYDSDVTRKKQQLYLVKWIGRRSTHTHTHIYLHADILLFCTRIKTESFRFTHSLFFYLYRLLFVVAFFIFAETQPKNASLVSNTTSVSPTSTSIRITPYNNYSNPTRKTNKKKRKDENSVK